MPVCRVRVSRPLESLTNDEIYDIHTAAPEGLRDVGVVFGDRIALKNLDESGCELDFKTGIVMFPESLVEEIIDRSDRNTRRGWEEKDRKAVLARARE